MTHEQRAAMWILIVLVFGILVSDLIHLGSLPRAGSPYAVCVERCAQEAR